MTCARPPYGQLLVEGRTRRRWSDVVMRAVLRWPPVTAAVFMGALLGFDALGRWLFG